MQKFELGLNIFLLLVTPIIRGQNWTFLFSSLTFSLVTRLILYFLQTDESVRQRKPACGFCLTFLANLVCLVWHFPAFARSDNFVFVCAFMNSSSCLLIICHKYVCQHFDHANEPSEGNEMIDVFLKWFFFLGYFCSIKVFAREHVWTFIILSHVLFIISYRELQCNEEMELDTTKNKKLVCRGLLASIGFAGFATRFYEKDSVSFILAILIFVCYSLQFLYIHIVRYLDIGETAWTRLSHPSSTAYGVASWSNTSVSTFSAPSVIGIPNTIIGVITPTARSSEQDSQAMSRDPPPYSQVVGSGYTSR
ncbi:hypothetical protein BgiMline_006059 [Biomphalaria glabrata]|nr:hypothetical protein BgiMline_004033 [Biomphalaria glabrata]